jgi:hypothetical protein
VYGLCGEVSHIGIICQPVLECMSLIVTMTGPRDGVSCIDIRGSQGEPTGWPVSTTGGQTNGRPRHRRVLVCVCRLHSALDLGRGKNPPPLVFRRGGGFAVLGDGISTDQGRTAEHAALTEYVGLFFTLVFVDEPGKAKRRRKARDSRVSGVKSLCSLRASLSERRTVAVKGISRRETEGARGT